MAFNGGIVAANTLKLYGQAATISWPNKALDASTSTSTVSTYAFIESKGASIPPSSFGNLTGLSGQRYVTAMLPLQSRDIAGATLTVAGVSYVVASATIEAGSYISAVLQ